jgi:hypothetical protein
MRRLLFPIILLLGITNVSAQDTADALPSSSLMSLDGFSFPVWHSTGQEQRAQEMAELCERAMEFMDSVLQFRPAMELKVLSATDWSAHTSFPVYGMPHPVEERILVLAAEDNPFWQSFIPDLSQLPPDLAVEVRSVYGTAYGGLSMQPFFDLLVLHELGHLYHLQKPVNFGRAWLGELFANVFLHTLIAERGTGRLAALVVFPSMVVSRGTEGFQFTTLQELEANYALIASEHPKNYGWYQCKWHMAAANIYDQAGVDALRNYWNCFMVERDPLNDDELKVLLQESVHLSVASMWIDW